ncbi:Pentatricopeptide repeat-containing protein [Forsythia ovata]|uniref:Pentatricopeptide repeat-containing protein n=1 Tax=Forsythia ovata TaxID=205694 RepID=A0ABD1PLJ8_9LAMI
MLRKSKHFYSFWQLVAPLRLSTLRQDYFNNSGVDDFLCNEFCTMAETIRGDDSSFIAESAALPDWVKFSDEDTVVSKSRDDDFVPPSISYWIENPEIRDHETDIKSIVNDIVESDVNKISKVLKNQFKSTDEVMDKLNCSDFNISEGLVEQILKRFSCEWIPAFGLFKWAEFRGGMTHSPDLYNLMVDNLGKAKKFHLMWELVEEMNKLEGYVTLDTMTKVMRRLAKAGKYQDAIEAFKKMELFGVDRDITAMNLLMDALVKQGSVEYAEKVLLEFKDQISPTLQTWNVLVHGWCKARQISKAKKTVDVMKNHGFSSDMITYTNFIEAYCREKDFRKVDATLEEMQKNGCHPSIVTYTIIMNALGRAKEINKALEIYEKMKQNGCSPDASFYSCFIFALSKAGRLKDSYDVFEDMSKQGVAPDVLTYNTLITIAAQHLHEERALKLLKTMEESGCKPDLNTYAPLLKMCCRLKRMKVLSFLLNHMFKNDVSIDLGMYSLLVRGLCRNGKHEHACSYFEESVLKGFVPMDCMYKNLAEELEKRGKHKEKERVEELMLQAKQQGYEDFSMPMVKIQGESLHACNQNVFQ